MPLLPSQRHLFDIPDDIAYFNCASSSPQLNESQRRLHTGARSKSHPWERTMQSFFEYAETIRRLSAEIFGGDADGYAVIPAASYGMSTAAVRWSRQPELRPAGRRAGRCTQRRDPRREKTVAQAGTEQRSTESAG